MNTNPTTRIDLRLERMLRGISLEELSRETKIPISQLQAIEERLFYRLPPGPIGKGYIKTYWQYLGLDPKLLGTELMWMEKDIRVQSGSQGREEWKRGRAAPVTGFFIVLIVLLILMARPVMNGHRSVGGEEPAGYLPGLLPWKQVPTILSGWAEQDVSLDRPDFSGLPDIHLPAPLTVEIIAVDAAWIRMTYITDGRAVLKGLFPRDSEVLTIEDEMVIELSDPQKVLIAPMDPIPLPDIPREKALHFIPSF